MFTYNSLVEACKNLDLNPEIKGTNIYVIKGRPCEAFEKPFDLHTIKFPQKELTEVESIGTLIFNLASQKKFPSFYDLGSAAGKEESRRDNAIEKFLPAAIEAQQFWLKKGLKICKCKEKEFILDYGTIYEVDPSFQEGMNKMNKRMEEVHRDFIRKNAASEISARNIHVGGNARSEPSY